MKVKARLTPFSIVLIYVVIAAAWIGFSDRAMLALPQDLQTIAVVSILKGWAFVLVTGAMLYFLIRRHAAEREEMLSKEREARLLAEQAAKARDDFLALASHELRTPLTPLNMYLQLLRRQLRAASPYGIPNCDALLKAIENTDTEVRHLSTLVDNLLAIPELTSGELALKRQELDIVSLLLEETEYLKPEAERLNTQLILRLPGKLSGFWDRQKLGQAIGHLLSNALKYGAGKPVEISLEREEGAQAAVLKIQDHGIGISKDAQLRLFRRFERAAPVEHYGGFGLGLFIVHAIVTAHGGSISIDSESEKGALFVVTLPLAGS